MVLRKKNNINNCLKFQIPLVNYFQVTTVQLKTLEKCHIYRPYLLNEVEI